MDPFYFLLILVMGLSFMVSARFKNRFNKYSKVATGSGLSGREIAEKMLADYGIHDVQVVSGKGMLSDHYNPLTKTISLSPEVYNGRSVAAAAVAAHECGHAVQHATQYAWLQFRSFMVPVVSVSAQLAPFLILGGFLLMSTFPQLLLFGIIAFAFSTVFSFVTLPVEFDASKRALVWLEDTNITYGEEHKLAKNALKWAAATYVIAALGSLASLLYYIRIFMARN